MSDTIRKGTRCIMFLKKVCALVSDVQNPEAMNHRNLYQSFIAPNTLPDWYTTPRHQKLLSAVSRNFNRTLVHLVSFLVGIRHLDSKNQGAQCLETFIGKLGHLIPLLLGIRHLDTRIYGAQCVENLIGNLVYVVPFLVGKQKPYLDLFNLRCKNTVEPCFHTFCLRKPKPG